MSRSIGARPAASSAGFAARTQKSESTSPSLAIRRSRIPVRDVIHSSDVSTIFSRSAFERIRSGNARPVPAIVAWSIVPPSERKAGCYRLRAGGANVIALARILSGIRRSTKSCAALIALRTALAFERPCPMRHAPFTPRSGAPPYSL